MLGFLAVNGEGLIPSKSISGIILAKLMKVPVSPQIAKE